MSDFAPTAIHVMNPIRLSLAPITVFTCFAAAAADWPQYRGPSLDGTTPESLGNTSFPPEGPKVLWRVPTPNGFSSFAVASGRAFTQVAREVDGVEQEVVVALDANTGVELWSRAVGVKKYGHNGGNAGTRDNKGGDGPRSTPAIAGDHLYVLSSDLELTCFTAADGQVVWQHDILQEHKGKNISWKNAASPVIDGDLVFAAGGGKGQALLAFDRTSGKVVWQVENDAMTHATPVLAEIEGTRQVIFFTQDGLVSLTPKTGALLWRQEFPFRVSTAASPVVSENIVYCSAGYGVGAAAFRVTRRGDRWETRELWRSKGDQPIANHWSTPVVKNGFLYGMFSFKQYGDGPIKCVDIATGQVLWEKEGFGPGNVILSGDTVIALGDAGQLVLLAADPKEYRELARADVLEGKCWSTPVLSGGRIYARSTKEGVCLELPGE